MTRPRGGPGGGPDGVTEDGPGEPRPTPTAQAMGGPAEIDALRATCRRQAHVIDALDAALSTLEAERRR